MDQRTTVQEPGEGACGWRARVVGGVRFDPDKTTAAMDRMQQATNACDLPKPAEHPAG